LVSLSFGCLSSWEVEGPEFAPRKAHDDDLSGKAVFDLDRLPVVFRTASPRFAELFERRAVAMEPLRLPVFVGLLVFPPMPWRRRDCETLRLATKDRR
jgi:hypothetical protein